MGGISVLGSIYAFVTVSNVQEKVFLVVLLQ